MLQHLAHICTSAMQTGAGLFYGVADAFMHLAGLERVSRHMWLQHATSTRHNSSMRHTNGTLKQ